MGKNGKFTFIGVWTGWSPKTCWCFAHLTKHIKKHAFDASFELSAVVNERDELTSHYIVFFKSGLYFRSSRSYLFAIDIYTLSRVLLKFLFHAKKDVAKRINIFIAFSLISLYSTCTPVQNPVRDTVGNFIFCEASEQRSTSRCSSTLRTLPFSLAFKGPLIHSTFSISRPGK